MVDLMRLKPGEDWPLLTLETRSKDLLREWFDEVESKISKGGEWNGILYGWEGKVVGNTIRIAGLLKMLDEPRLDSPVTAKHFLAAVEIMRYFIAQALALGGNSSGLSSGARQVLAVIQKRGELSFSPSSMRQRLRDRKQFERGEAVDAAFGELEAAGYLRLGPQPEVGGKGGRPGEAPWLVHPGLFKATPCADTSEVFEL